MDEEEGLVYFVRSGNVCGSDVHVMRVPLANLGATPTNLVTLPVGIDVDYQMTLVDVGAQVDLWFSRVHVPPSRETSTGSATSGSPERQARASGFVRHVGPPSPFREISSPS